MEEFGTGRHVDCCASGATKTILPDNSVHDSLSRVGCPRVRGWLPPRVEAARQGLATRRCVLPGEKEEHGGHGLSRVTRRVAAHLWMMLTGIPLVSEG
jgi:hypothetical protein